MFNYLKETFGLEALKTTFLLVVGVALVLGVAFLIAALGRMLGLHGNEGFLVIFLTLLVVAILCTYPRK